MQHRPSHSLTHSRSIHLPQIPLDATQLQELLRFKPVRGAMKKRLESLIDREYVERDATDRAVVHYVPA